MGQGLTRPEIAILLSLSKIALDHELLASALPDNPACHQYLVGYFPKALRERFPADIESHRLKREIIATFVVNAMINRGGPAFAVRLGDETGRSPADIACAFLAARSFLDLSPVWTELHAIGGVISGQLQLDLYARTQDALLEQTAELLRGSEVVDIEAISATNATTMRALEAGLLTILTPGQGTRHADLVSRLTIAGVPQALASRLSMLDLVGSIPALTRLAMSSGRPVTQVAAVAFAASEHLRVGELKTRASKLKTTDHYDRLALNSAISTLDASARGLTRDVLAGAAPGREASFASWAAANGQKLLQAKAALDEIASSGELTVSRLTVAAQQARDVAGTTIAP